MAAAPLTGLAAIQAKIAKLPSLTEGVLRAQLNVEARDLVSADQRAAIAQGVEPVAQALHYQDAPNRQIGVVVIANPKDEKGKDIGSNIEAGHKTVAGGQVRPLASFYPTYRARKPGMRRRISKAARDAIKALWGA